MRMHRLVVGRRRVVEDVGSAADGLQKAEIHA